MKYTYIALLGLFILPISAHAEVGLPVIPYLSVSSYTKTLPAGAGGPVTLAWTTTSATKVHFTLVGSEAELYGTGDPTYMLSGVKVIDASTGLDFPQITLDRAPNDSVSLIFQNFTDEPKRAWAVLDPIPAPSGEYGTIDWNAVIAARKIIVIDIAPGKNIPTIEKITPNKVQIGSKIIIKGTNFTATGNHVSLETTVGGIKGNVAYGIKQWTLPSTDGKTLTIEIPAKLEAYGEQYPTWYGNTIDTAPGVYQIAVQNSQGSSRISLIEVFNATEKSRAVK